MTTIYKITPRGPWQEAERRRRYHGSPVDRADGFIHFSTADQVKETAAKHFAGQADLLLVAVDGDALGDRLRWEPSRGGALFPHLYGSLPIKAVLWTRAMPLEGSEHVVPLPDEDGAPAEEAPAPPTPANQPPPKRKRPAKRKSVRDGTAGDATASDGPPGDGRTA